MKIFHDILCADTTDGRCNCDPEVYAFPDGCAEAVAMAMFVDGRPRVTPRLAIRN
jgi:hypothetical protein